MALMSSMFVGSEGRSAEVRRAEDGWIMFFMQERLVISSVEEQTPCGDLPPPSSGESCLQSVMACGHGG